MTTIETHADAGGSSVVSFFVGAGAWSTTTDHKRIGRIYVGFGLLGLLVSSALAFLLGWERASTSSELFEAGSLLQVFQAYRIGLVFAGIVPLTLGLAIAVVPLQLGARQITFPRLALTGCYAWIGGLALTMAALARNGGIGGGDTNAVDLFLAGHGLMILGLLASAGSVATTILTSRAPGMTMRRVPLFAWSALIGALGMLLALPVLFGVIVLVFVDHRIGTGLNFGGEMGSWIGWAYSVPAVTVYALPAVGVAAELVPVTFRSRQQVRGVTFAGIALVGITALAATTQQFVFDVSLGSDQSFGAFVDDLLPFLIFSGLPILGVLIVMALGGLTAKTGAAHGRPRVTAPFVFAFLGLAMIAAGLVATALQGILELDLYEPSNGVLSDRLTSFEEGATLLVVYGSVLGVIGGLTFWAPKLWGRLLPDKKVAPLALLGLGGCAVSGLSLCIAGLLGAPGGVAGSEGQVDDLLSLSYDSHADLWNVLSMIGQGMMLVTVLAFVGLMLATFTGRGEPCADNPYGGHTLEWATSSPAPTDNFDTVPTVASPSPVFDLTADGSTA